MLIVDVCQTSRAWSQESVGGRPHPHRQRETDKGTLRNMGENRKQQVKNWTAAKTVTLKELSKCRRGLFSQAVLGTES